ncbi:MAG: hypothetical protein G3I08_09190 [Ferrovum sp.]|nr:hypothetical protein [Ferrovum sp.]
MKRYIKQAIRVVGLLWGTLWVGTPAFAFELGDPGFYGPVVVGPGPAPQLISPQPIWVAPTPYGVAPPPPLYLRVPPRVWHHWPNFCVQYAACGRPVYFVTNSWYLGAFVPYYRLHPEFWHREGGPWMRDGHPEGERWREGERGRWREGRDHEHH